MAKCDNLSGAVELLKLKADPRKPNRDDKLQGVHLQLSRRTPLSVAVAPVVARATAAGIYRQ